VGPYGNNVPNGQQVTGGDNLNFYQINTTSLPNREILIGNERKKIMLGDPTMPSTIPTSNWEHIDGYEYIETDQSNNHIVSPSFIVASRRGATSQMLWANGRERCRRYRESQYPAGTWRMPTFAELAMLGEMQNDNNSAIKDLFVPASGSNTGWWTALDAYRLRVDQYKYDGPADAVQQDNQAAVRCVRDTWKDYPQDHLGVYGEFRERN
jgi:hypothetical protein